MQIQTYTYAEFAIAVKIIGGIEAIFYHDNGVGTFYLSAVVGGRNISVFANGLTSKPASLDTDFPAAIETASPVIVSA